jgi:hypothetical protein
MWYPARAEGEHAWVREKNIATVRIERRRGEHGGVGVEPIGREVVISGDGGDS